MPINKEKTSYLVNAFGAEGDALQPGPALAEALGALELSHLPANDALAGGVLDDIRHIQDEGREDAGEHLVVLAKPGHLQNQDWGHL